MLGVVFLPGWSSWNILKTARMTTLRGKNQAENPSLLEGFQPTKPTGKKKVVFFQWLHNAKKPSIWCWWLILPLEVVIWEPLEQPVGCELFGENLTAKNQENECPKEDLKKSIIKPWEWWDRKTGGLEIPEACYTGSNPLHRRVQSLILAGHTKTQAPTSLL